MISGKFAISMHILTLLAYEEDKLLSSDYIAGSININPVLVRNELANLKKAGFVDSKEGKKGGSYLSRPAQQILLSDVYKAVVFDKPLGKSKNEPNPACPIGRDINEHLDALQEGVEQAMLQNLGKTTLASFLLKFK